MAIFRFQNTVHGTNLIYFLLISVLFRWPCQTSHPNSWFWCWHAIPWRTIVAGITGPLWEIWHSCHLQQVSGISSNEYIYFYKCVNTFHTFQLSLPVDPFSTCFMYYSNRVLITFKSRQCKPRWLGDQLL